ncbi:hypothetical protein BKA65DRAFT_569783 [Rhexocercosporidium sp. MPI-PUGE-AT-0058]|nr:hypothetical protein BKA65DRAFT_569783 [Rhexocercosporidium sp. MPI-PUGE-AT-0058]
MFVNSQGLCLQLLYRLPPSLPPAAKKVKISRSRFSAPLKVVVGPNAEEFFINGEVICAQSEFFKAACRDQWQSGRSRVITLVEDDPKLIAIFLTWLATGDIERCPDFVEVTATPNAEAILVEQNYAQWEQLRCCYNLGDVLLAPAFKNAAMNLLIEASETLLIGHNMFPCRTIQELETVYETTQKGSGLRKLVVDLAVKSMGIQSFGDLDIVCIFHSKRWEQKRN